MAVILVLVALLALRFWSEQKGKPERPIIRNRRAFFTQWVVGLIVALLAAFFMFDGDILGENATGIAAIAGIVGLASIGTSNVTLLGLGRRK